MAEWIEIIPKPEGGEEIASPLAMAEWIEMYIDVYLAAEWDVSASDGGVD